MALEPSSEVWVHGLFPLPKADLSEASLLKLIEHKPVAIMATPEQAVSMEQWASLTSRIGVTPPQAAAIMRLTFALTSPEKLMPPDHALRVPLGSLLLLLWVQWAHHELGESSATGSERRAQAASGEVWPSLLLPPAAAASSVLIDGNQQQPSARTLAVQARLGIAPLVRRRRKLLQASLPTLIQLVGAGAERLYAHELDRLHLLVRPDAPGTERLVSKALPADALSAALGLWSAQPKAALPLASLIPALRAALVEVVATTAVPSKSLSSKAGAAPNGSGGGGAGARSPLAAAPSNAPASSAATTTTAAAAAAAAAHDASVAPPDTPLRPTVSTSDTDAADSREAAVVALVASSEGAKAPGHEVLRLQGAKKRTLVLREAELRFGGLQLIDCHGCFVYCLAPVRALELLGCTGCTVVCGSVARVLSAAHCEGLRLHATCKLAKLANMHDTTCYLCVNAPPLLAGENHRLLLAPHATVYAGIAEHMAAACVLPELKHNYWRLPISAAVLAAAEKAAAEKAAAEKAAAGAPDAAGPVSPSPREPSPNSKQRKESLGGGSASGAEPPPGWAVLPPHRFLPFHVPVDVPRGAKQGAGVPPPCELPGEYAAALLGHVQRLALLGDELRDLSCPEDVRKEVQAALQGGFKEWLARTGNVRQLTDLMAQPAS